MAEEKTRLSRRQFVKTASMASVGAALIGCSKRQEPEEAPKAVTPTQEPEETPKSSTTAQEVPKRTFGKTGEQVSILSQGGILDMRQNQLLLNQALKMGVTYWDTSEGYINGASEEGMGQYFERNPEDRKKVFLVSKSKSRDPEGLTKSLAGSLERLKTSYVDMYFLHGIDDVEKSLTPEVKQWVEKAKSDGKIKYFGFSTHSNVEDCMEGAAKLGWVDGIMMAYNYRTMQTDRVKAAVDACTKAGIGLTAMKTQAKIPTGRVPQRPRQPLTKEQEEAMRARMAEMREGAEKAPPDRLTLELTERFRHKGFTLEQAKLNLVWENPQIASVCSAMYNMTVLMQNVAAATGNVRLSQKDKNLLAIHAAQTSHQYCPGCTHHCQSGSEKDLPIGVVMRCLMYARDYGDRDLGKTTFQSLPAEMRRVISRTDYTEAERRCPNNLPIGELMREAAIELA
jgi:predicted aldo/keto reductase-like oxidoreductase